MPANTASTSSSGQALMPTGAWNTSRFSPIAFSTTRGGGMILQGGAQHSTRVGAYVGGSGGGDDEQGIDTNERWLAPSVPAIDSHL